MQLASPRLILRTRREPRRRSGRAEDRPESTGEGAWANLAKGRLEFLVLSRGLSRLLMDILISLGIPRSCLSPFSTSMGSSGALSVISSYLTRSSLTRSLSGCLADLWKSMVVLMSRAKLEYPFAHWWCFSLRRP